jgi:hypothetical protein
MRLSICVFTCGFITTVLHYITTVKFFSCCQEIILDAELFMDLTLQFPGLHAHLTLILSISFREEY